MTLDHHTLLHLPVYTKLDQHLGRVVGFEVDSATQSIVRYTVSSGPFTRAFSKTLVISATQVISLDAEKMVVEDGVLSEPVYAKGGASVG